VVIGKAVTVPGLLVVFSCLFEEERVIAGMSWNVNWNLKTLNIKKKKSIFKNKETGYSVMY
jgi:hypothetical protein